MTGPEIMAITEKCLELQGICDAALEIAFDDPSAILDVGGFEFPGLISSRWSRAAGDVGRSTLLMPNGDLYEIVVTVDQISRRAPKRGAR